MKRLWIVKLGGTFEDLAAERGDFEHWVRRRIGVDDSAVAVVRPREGEPLPDPDRIAGAVLTGAHEMVTDRADWSEAAAAWLRCAVEAEIPILGICYGHQLLAHALGGRVGDHPDGREFGSVRVELLPSAGNDPLLGVLPRRFAGHCCHAQSVLVPPEGATLLATGRHDSHQAMRIGRCAWGVQFHPEFDAEVARQYVRRTADVLRREGRRVERILASIVETPESASVPARFAAIALDRRR